MDCVDCGSSAVTERPEITARGYRRYRCRDCGRQFNERSGGVLNRSCLPSDIIAFVVCRRLRWRLTLRDLCEIMAPRGIAISHEGTVKLSGLWLGKDGYGLSNDNIPEPDLCRLSPPCRGHQLCGLALFSIPVGPADGRGDAGGARHLGDIRDDPTVETKIQPGIR